MKWLYGGLSLVFVLLGMATLWQDDTPMVVVVAPRIHSFVHTDVLETIGIDLLASRIDTHHLDPAYIERADIVDAQQAMSFSVLEVVTGTETQSYDGMEMMPVRVVVSPRIVADASTLWLREATLVMYYLDGSQWSVPIGEFTYRWDMGDTDDLGLWSLHATSEVVGGIETVSAIQIEWYNRTNDRIDILSVDVLAQGVTTNPAMARRDWDCTDIPSVAACLDVAEYAFFQDAVPTVLHVNVAPKQSVRLYVPLLYEDVLPLHRFGIVVTYRIAGVMKTTVIDDFPFVRSDSFAASDVTGAQRRVLD